MNATVKIALALTLGLGVSAANAALLEIKDSGTSITPVLNYPSEEPCVGDDCLPGGSPVVGDNWVLDPVTGFDMTGQLGDAWTVHTTKSNVTLQYFYLGAESAATNTLNYGGNTHTETGGSPNGESITPSGLELMPLVTQPAVGDIDLFFTSTNFPGNLGLGECPIGDECDPSIAVAYLHDFTVDEDGTPDFTGARMNLTQPSDWVVFGLDDGAVGDDNHDDYVGVVQATPIPAPLFLIGSALVGLAGLRARRSRREA